MHTYLLGAEEVRGYARDFLRRLSTFEPFPNVWCPVTESGNSLLKAIYAEAQRDENLINTVQLLPIGVRGDVIEFIKEKPEEVIPGKVVLLLDGAIHSGQAMFRCAEKILSYSPADLCSYALVIKRGSVFFPTLWSLMIDETDRAYFLLDEIPNNRLNAGVNRSQPPVILERLNEHHFDRPLLDSGVKSIDRVTWGDRFYQMRTAGTGTCTYVLKRTQTIVGFLTTYCYPPNSLSIGEIVVDRNHQGFGYGGILMRFADTLARQANCRSVRLHAISNMVRFYEKFGYRPTPGEEPVRLDDENYQSMERPVLYNQRIESME